MNGESLRKGGKKKECGWGFEKGITWEDRFPEVPRRGPCRAGNGRNRDG